jgi:hypothetical protein
MDDRTTFDVPIRPLGEQNFAFDTNLNFPACCPCGIRASVRVENAGVVDAACVYYKLPGGEIRLQWLVAGSGGRLRLVFPFHGNYGGVNKCHLIRKRCREHRKKQENATNDSVMHIDSVQGHIGKSEICLRKSRIKYSSSRTVRTDREKKQCSCDVSD